MSSLQRRPTRLLLPAALLAWLVAGGAGAGIVIEPRAQQAATPFAGGSYRALLIGNDVYRDPEGRWPALRTAVSDARALQGVLMQGYGFTDVQVLENATRREVLFALGDLAQRVNPEDSVLIYYAGHGFLDPDTRKGFWVPVDARGTDHSTFLRNSTIRDELTIIADRARHTLLISDSCFSGSLLRSTTRSISPDLGDERYYRQVARKRSVQILSAGGLEYVDDDYRRSGHSPFTYFLLHELAGNERPLLVASELAAEVTRAVANNAGQLPESGVLQGAGDELGEFIFLKLDVHVSGVPADKVKVQVKVISDQPTAPAAEQPPPAAPPARAPEEPRLLPVPTL